MYESGRISKKVLCEPSGRIIHDLNRRAKQETDDNSVPLYKFVFKTKIPLNCDYNKEFKSFNEQGFDKDQIDEVFNMAVRDFALELARVMEYKNYKNLELHGITSSEADQNE